MTACEACGEDAFDGIRCGECGSMSEAHLHDMVKRDLRIVRDERIEMGVSHDRKWPRIAA